MAVSVVSLTMIVATAWTFKSAPLAVEPSDGKDRSKSGNGVDKGKFYQRREG